MTDPSASTTTAKPAGFQSKLLLIATGVLVPLLAALVPFLIDLVSPKTAFTFQTVGPVRVDSTTAFSLSIRNEGKATERAVELWLPAQLKAGSYKLDASITPTVRDDGKSTVIAFGDLRPKEEVEVSMLVDDRLWFLHVYRMKELRVVSADAKASWDGPSEEAYFLYRAGTWAFLIILAAAVLAGIYQEKFMSREAREKMLLKEIDKLK